MFFEHVIFLSLTLGSFVVLTGATTRSGTMNRGLTVAPLILLLLLPLLTLDELGLAYGGGWGGAGSSLPITFFFLYPFLAALLFVTFFSIFYVLAYNRQEFTIFLGFIGGIFINAFLFFHVNVLLLFFFSYEMFLLPAFFVLYLFSKTRRAVEAAIYMFFWTQFGALALFLSFLYLTSILHITTFTQLMVETIAPGDGLLLSLLWFIGFGVKIPLWPFYGWLPKAHVEASTNFSIFLSGVLVKFAFFGLLRCLMHLHFDALSFLLLPPIFIGIIDGTWKLFSQIDLKKMVAYMTVIEMHWLCLAVLSGYSPLIFSAMCMLFNHALLSTQAFLLVDAVARRYKTRLIFEIQGVSGVTPILGILILSNLLLFLGFPGTLSFIAEFLFFIFIFDTNPLFFLLSLVFLYLLAPSFFFKNWFNVLFNSPVTARHTPVMDVTAVELGVLGQFSMLSLWLGLNWQYFLLV